MRKTVPAIALAIVVVLSATGALYYNSHDAPPGSDQTFQCSDPDSISSQVYNPYRLTVVKSCITASGVVGRVLNEADGDYHVRLILDGQYGNLTNSANSSTSTAILSSR
ncbi:MAG TPA: hypothetical protein VE955_11820 [Candidatus Dormibacteraeota bacterium]|nr:hypothetical protein [Candidatus Dormibacteraeota bacterium]